MQLLTHTCKGYVLSSVDLAWYLIVCIKSGRHTGGSLYQIVASQLARCSAGPQMIF